MALADFKMYLVNEKIIRDRPHLGQHDRRKLSVGHPNAGRQRLVEKAIRAEWSLHLGAKITD